MITNNYKKMCEMARNIQKAWRPKDCDIFCYVKSREIGEVCSDNKKHTQKEYDENLEHQFWIPTQEQLQEIYGYKMPIHKIPYMERPYYLIDKLYNCIYVNKYSDMNELWLAFVMYEKYNKIWTGEKWVKGDT